MAKKKEIVAPILEPVALAEKINAIALNDELLKVSTSQKTKDTTAEHSIEQIKRKEAVIGKLSGERVVLPSSDAARDLYAQSRFGTVLAGGKVQLSLLEAVYLEEKERITITDSRGRKLSHEQLLQVGKKTEKVFFVKYSVFKDLRSRGYIVKTALKFGADFRVYDRGVKPGDDHAKWIVFPVHESGHLTWYDLASKNRVAHSTKKRLLIGIVDEEGDVTYFELRWLRP